MTSSRRSTAGRNTGRRRPIGYASWEPRAAARATLEAVREVLVTYAQYLPLTLRQVFYALVGQDVLEKSEVAYERLGEIVNRARRARLLDFEDIRDDGVTELAYPYYDSTEGFWNDVEEQIHGYRRNRQAGQPAFIELWCEAAGMVPQLFRVAAPFGIPVFSSGGFNSTTANWELAQRALGRSVPTVIMHLGDFDPSGESIFHRTADDAAEFVLADRANPSIHVAGVRVALTEKQIKQYDLPTAPPKGSDSRAANWRGKDTGTCQLEALPPDLLASIIRAKIAELMDLPTLEAELKREAADKRQLLDRLR